MPFSHLCLPNLNPIPSGLQPQQGLGGHLLSSPGFSTVRLPTTREPIKTGKQPPPVVSLAKGGVRASVEKKHSDTACFVWSARRDHPHSLSTPTNTPSGFSTYPGLSLLPRPPQGRSPNLCATRTSCVFVDYLSLSCRWQVEAEVTNVECSWKRGRNTYAVFPP